MNLGLHVCAKRSDGFHDIETVFLPIPWFDHLRAAPAETFRFTCSDPHLPVDESNLCVRAAHMLMIHLKLPGVALHLEKRLPYGAGLGGGSSDAAHTLRLLNDFWHLNLDKNTLHTFAAALGSDVPFFLEDTAMYATGRGEVMEALVHPVSGAPYQFPFEMVLVIPPVHVSTADAYQHIKPNKQGRPDLREVVLSNNLARWRPFLVNDFETSVCAAYPLITEVKKRLLAEGAGYAAMSGSGSAVFGVFDDAARAGAAASRFEAMQMRVCHVQKSKLLDILE